MEIAGNTLSPRQPIARTPYAMQVKGIVVDPGDRVGMGTSNPRARLDVRADSAGASDNTARFAAPNIGPRSSHIHYGTTGDWFIRSASTSGEVLIQDGGGNVGVGTSAPSVKLHVNGGTDASLGGGGFIVNGSVSGTNLALDNNEIMARNNGGPASLHLNAEGGDVVVNGAASPAFGIGNSNPFWPLDVRAPYAVGRFITDDNAFGAVLELRSLASNPHFLGAINFVNASNQVRGQIGYRGDVGALEFNTWAGAGAMYINNWGGVGLGGLSAVYTLEVHGGAGKPGGGSWSNTSDVRLKKDIEPIESALDSLLQLRGVTFEYIDSESINELPGQRMGMIAQEVEKVFPDWVDERRDGYKSVTFRGFEALTVEALRELKEENKALRSRLSERDSMIDELAQRTAMLEQLVAELAASSEKE